MTSLISTCHINICLTYNLFNQGQELETYHMSQVKKHYGPTLVNNIPFKKAPEVVMPSVLRFLFEEFLKFQKCNFSTHY